MKAAKIFQFICIAAMLVLTCLSVFTAIKGGAEWRASWDYIWKWNNFVILVFVIGKFLWPFMQKFLRERVACIADEIGQYEKEQAEIETEIRKIEESLSQTAQKFDQLKAKMQTELKQKQEQIVEHAKKEATAIVEQASLQQSAMLNETKKLLKAELVDLAVNEALNKLPGLISAKDQERLFKNFYNNAFKAPQTA